MYPDEGLAHLGSHRVKYVEIVDIRRHESGSKQCHWSRLTNCILQIASCIPHSSGPSIVHRRQNANEQMSRLHERTMILFQPQWSLDRAHPGADLEERSQSPDVLGKLSVLAGAG